MRKKAILLGIDGATWNIIRPAVTSNELPHFRRLISKSSIGIIESTKPPSSPPAWTSMFTGVNPGKHGIVDFTLREKDGFVRCWSRYRMCKTIWQILSDSGVRCIIVNNPVEFPPEPINGIMTTGFLTPPGSKNWVYPANLRSEINAIAHGYEFDIPEDFSPTTKDGNASALQKLDDLASKVHRVSRHLVSNYEWDVLAVIFTTTDRLQHFWWNDLNKIIAHFKVLDGMLKDYVDLANKNSAELIVVSDHGFGPINHVVRIQKWLEELGLISYKKSATSKSMSRVGLTKPKIARWLRRHPSISTLLPNSLLEVAKKHVPEGKEEMNITDTVAFAKTAAGIFVEDKNRLDFIESKLREMTYNGGSKLVFKNIIRREQALHGPYSYRAPDLFLEPSLGCFVSHEREGEPETNGTHRLDGIYIHYRPTTIEAEVAPVGTIRPWDVAATILRILDVPVPEYFDGKPVNMELA